MSDIMPEIEVNELNPLQFIARSSNPLIAELLGSDPPVDWVLPDFLPQGSLIALAGQPGAGKSYLCYTIGMALATGTPIFGLVPPQPVKVLYFDNENANPDRIQYERWAWTGLDKPSLQLLEKNFWRQPFQLGGNDWSHRLEQDITFFKPRVVFIDTASPCFNVQDENDNAEATRIINKLRACQASISPTVTMVVLKHSKIKAEDTGSGYHTLRGAKTWEGSVDAIVYQVPGAGRPRNDGLRNTRLQPSKTRAFGLRSAIEIVPSWVGDKEGIKLERR